MNLYQPAFAHSRCPHSSDRASDWPRPRGPHRGSHGESVPVSSGGSAHCMNSLRRPIQSLLVLAASVDPPPALAARRRRGRSSRHQKVTLDPLTRSVLHADEHVLILPIDIPPRFDSKRTTTFAADARSNRARLQDPSSSFHFTPSRPRRSRRRASAARSCASLPSGEKLSP